MKQTKMAWLAGLVLVAAAMWGTGCSSLTPEALEAGAAQARKLAGTAGIEERLAAVEERMAAGEERDRLAYAFTWLTAEKAGITETAARDWLAGRTAPSEDEAEEPAADVDAVEFAKLKWKFGGKDGSKAALSSPRLSGLKAGSKSISYKWEQGLSDWGLSNGDAGALACLFVERSDGEIVGGKFDWVSTSRSSRGLENIFEGYSGWTLDGVPNPAKCYFVVLSSDGRKRSNIVGAEWKR